MEDHTAIVMDRDLKSIINKIEAMGGISENMLASAVEAIVSANIDLAHATIAFDKQLDALQRQLDTSKNRFL